MKPIIGISGSVIIDDSGIFQVIVVAMLMKIMLILLSRMAEFLILFPLMKMKK